MFDLNIAIANINAIATDWQASPSLAEYHPQIIDDNWTKVQAIEQLTKDKGNNGQGQGNGNDKKG